MHPEAHDAVARFRSELNLVPVSILDIGGRNVNGSLRDLFPGSRYTALDIIDGEGVDIVADAATWEPTDRYDLVLSTECFEHTPDWLDILDTIHASLEDAGAVIITAASDPRAPHSGIDGGPLRSCEPYANVDPDILRDALQARFDEVHVETHPRGDVYAWAR